MIDKDDTKKEVIVKISQKSLREKVVVSRCSRMSGLSCWVKNGDSSLEEEQRK